jgi:hypothetical protein
MNSWTKNSWIKFLNFWSCSSTRSVIWINFVNFFVQLTSINFHHLGALDQKLEAIYQDLWVKAISCTNFFNVGPIKKLVYLTIYLWVNSKAISCNNLFYARPINKLICLTTYLWVNNQAISCSNLSDLSVDKYWIVFIIRFPLFLVDQD